MPQLKPIFWLSSDLMVMMIIFMLILIYYYKNESVEFLKLVSKVDKYMMKW